MSWLLVETRAGRDPLWRLALARLRSPFVIHQGAKETDRQRSPNDLRPIKFALGVALISPIAPRTSATG